MVFPKLETQDFNPAQAPMFFGQNMLSLYTTYCRLRNSLYLSCCYDRAIFESLSLGASKVITNTEWMERASHRKYILEGSEVPSISNTKLVEGGTRLVLS